MKYAFIERNRCEFSISAMCRVLEVHRSGFYAWLRKPESNRAIADRVLMTKIQRSFEQSNKAYGSPRIHQDLRNQGVFCGRKRIARLMRSHGLIAFVGYKKRRYKAGKPAVVAPNLINRNFTADAPNRVWTTDITYVRCRSGWLYLVTILDLFSRKIVGWSVGRRMTTDLAIHALRQAVWRRRPMPGLLVHSDQGSQYGSHNWVGFLKTHGMKQSMSRRGNCYDNAVKESFFGSLKTEHIRSKIYESVEEARSDIFSYIEMFYNPKRLHSYLGYLSPDKFERISTS